VGDAEAISSGLQWWWILGVIGLTFIFYKLLKIR
jgi:hypothetical protein